MVCRQWILYRPRSSTTESSHSEADAQFYNDRCRDIGDRTSVSIEFFGLAIPVIQLGGGILICKTAMELLGDSGSSDKEEASKNVDGFRWKNIEQKIFYPITFPISIGPGSISVIFTLMASASVKGKLLQTGINYLVIALVIICMAAIFYVFLSQGQRFYSEVGTGGKSNY